MQENYLELKAAAAHFAKAYDEDGMSAAEQTASSTEDEDEDDHDDHRDGDEVRELNTRATCLNQVIRGHADCVNTVSYVLAPHTRPVRKKTGDRVSRDRVKCLQRSV